MAKKLKKKTTIPIEDQDFVDKSVEIIDTLTLENNVLKSKIEHLETLLKEAKSIPTIGADSDKPMRKPLEEEIIEIEIKRLHDGIIRGDTLEGSDLRKFDTLVKGLVALRGKPLKKDKKKGDELDSASTEDLMSIVSNLDLN